MKALLQILDQPENDFWSDVLADDARDCLDSYSPDVLGELRQNWRELSKVQQVHLAYILEGGKSSEEDLLISEMMTSSDKEVSFRAWEAKQNGLGEHGSAGNRDNAGKFSEDL